MSEQSIRVNLWFHRDNEKESRAYECIAAAKNAGRSYTEYITEYNKDRDFHKGDPPEKWG